MDIANTYKYCPRCGNDFSILKNYLKCNKCDLSFYLNPKPCTAAVLKNSKDEILLVERAVDPKKGWWDLPGGFIEENETIEQAVRREIKEELDVNVGKLIYFKSYFDKYLFQDVEYSTLGAVFIGQIKDDAKIIVDDDVAGYRFFKLKDIPMDRISFPSIRKTFEDLLANL